MSAGDVKIFLFRAGLYGNRSHDPIVGRSATTPIIQVNILRRRAIHQNIKSKKYNIVLFTFNLSRHKTKETLKHF